MKIPFVNLNLQWRKEKKDLLKIIDQTLANDNWVGGKNIHKFEKNIAGELFLFCVLYFIRYF